MRCLLFVNCSFFFFPRNVLLICLACVCANVFMCVSFCCIFPANRCCILVCIVVLFIWICCCFLYKLFLLSFFCRLSICGKLELSFIWFSVRIYGQTINTNGYYAQIWAVSTICCKQIECEFTAYVWNSDGVSELPKMVSDSTHEQAPIWLNLTHKKLHLIETLPNNIRRFKFWQDTKKTTKNFSNFLNLSEFRLNGWIYMNIVWLD